MSLFREKNLQNRPITAGSAAVLATLLGALVRCFYVFQSDFPLSDGGMFYTMVKDLQAAHFHLPAFTSYNFSSIPYVYPPLPFYLTAALNSFFKIDLLQLLRFIPLFFSIATIPAFYWLARQLLKNDLQIGAATFVFALFSPSFTWQLMGGGLTRSPALFFTVLALAEFVIWVKTDHWKNFAGVALFTALTTLCHLEMLLMLVLSYLAIMLVCKRSWKFFRKLALAGVCTIVLIAPWWGTVIAQHGISPFINASKVGSFSLLTTVAYIFGLTPTQDLNEIIFTLAGLAGAAILISRRDWLLSVWWLTFVVLDPRSTQRSVTIPIALLAGVAIDEAFRWLNRNLPVFKKKPQAQSEQGQSVVNSSLKFLLIFILIFVFFTDMVGKYTGHSFLVSVNPQNRQAMEWVKQHTPTESRFLVISNPTSWSVDIIGEWFPTLAERKSLLTAQGMEWLPDKAQAKTIKELGKISGCRMKGLNCLEEWITAGKVDVDYVYLTDNSQDISGTRYEYSSVVEAQMAESSNYLLVFSNEDVKIFQMNK